LNQQVKQNLNTVSQVKARQSSKQSDDEDIESAPKQQKMQVAKDVPKNWRKISKFREPLLQDMQQISVLLVSECMNVNKEKYNA